MSTLLFCTSCGALYTDARDPFTTVVIGGTASPGQCMRCFTAQDATKRMRQHAGEWAFREPSFEEAQEGVWESDDLGRYRRIG